MKRLGLVVLLTACIFAFGVVSAQAEIIYGIKNPPAGGPAEIYKIDLSTDPCTLTLMATYTLPSDVPIPTASYNGNGYDAVNDRYYFSTYDNKPRILWRIDNFSTAPSLPVAVGELSGGISNGSFYEEKYYCMGHNTDDLYVVEFTATGLSETPIADITGNTKNFYFGDIAMGPGGVLYGSVGTAAYPGSPSSTSNPGFFIYDGTYNFFPGHPEALQIAFGDDGVLYGYSIAQNIFYSIDTSNGAFTYKCASTKDFSDLARGSAEPPIPVPEINIKPYSWPNAINTCSSGGTPVIIWGSESFDVTKIILETLTFGDKGLKVVGKGKKELFVIDDFGQPDPNEFDQINPMPDGYLDLNAKFDTYEMSTFTEGMQTLGKVCFDYDVNGDGSYVKNICVTQEVYLSRDCSVTE